MHQYRGSLCDRRFRRVRDTHVAKGSFSFDAWRFLDVRFDLGDSGESVTPAGLAAYDDGMGDSSPIEEQMLARLGLRRWFAWSDTFDHDEVVEAIEARCQPEMSLALDVLGSEIEDTWVDTERRGC